jgi:hypothetical protein
MDTASAARPNVVVRLGLSLVVGALAGIYAGAAAPVVDGLIALALFLVPPLVSLAVDPRITRKGAAILRYMLPLALLLVIAGVIAWRAASPNLSAPVVSIAQTFQVLAILFVPTVAAFAFGSVSTELQSTITLAIGCALAAWVGMGVRNLTQAMLTGSFSGANGNDLAFLGLVVIVLLYVLGFFAVVFEGLLGAWLHAWATPKAMS